MLAFVLVATLPLEVLLQTRVYARARRTLLTVLCVAVPFVGWDLLAHQAGHWEFDDARTVGVDVLGLPVEEVLFFVVVPLASLLTLEAVRSVKRWPVGDEPEAGA